MYGRGLTPFLALARDAGAVRLADGVGMLVEQAAEGFHWWRGVRPETREVVVEKPVFIDTVLEKEVEYVIVHDVNVPTEKEVEVTLNVQVERPVYQEFETYLDMNIENNVVEVTESPHVAEENVEFDDPIAA